LPIHSYKEIKKKKKKKTNKRKRYLIHNNCDRELDGSSASSGAGGLKMTVSKQPWNNNPNNENDASANSAASSAVKAVATRPKSVSQWSVVDVQKWFRKNCGDYYHLYSEKLLEQDITGKTSLL
jgi:hypothetical protein